MFYFLTEDVDNLKRLREMVTENLINETDYADAKGTILAVARKHRQKCSFASSFVPFCLKKDQKKN